MNWSGIRALVVIALAAAALSGCHSNVYTPFVPTTVDTTATFTGNLSAAGTVYQTFLVRPGTVTVTLSGLTPDSGLRMTMAIGVYNQYYLTCSDLIVNDNTHVNTALQGLATATTALCVRLTDSTAAVPTTGETYTITVTRVPSS